MTDQYVKYRVRVEKVLNDDCIPVLPHTSDVVAPLRVVVIFKQASRACPARGGRRPRNRLLLQRVNSSRQAPNLLVR